LRRAPLRTAAFFLLALLAAGFGPPDAQAVSYSLAQNAGTDVLTLGLDGELPSFTAIRTGRRRLALNFGPQFWIGRDQPAADDLAGDVLQSVVPTPSGFELTTKSDAFGFIATSTQQPPAVRVMAFPDPLGARWAPPAPSQDAPPAQEQASGVSNQSSEPQPSPQERPPQPQVVRRRDAPPAEPAPQPVNPAEEQSLGSPQSGGVVGSMQGARRPYYSVPYTLRGEVRDVGPSEAAPMSTVGDSPANFESPMRIGGAVAPPAKPEVNASPAENETSNFENGVASGAVNQPVAPPSAELADATDVAAATPPAAVGGEVKASVQPPSSAALDEQGEDRPAAPPAVTEAAASGGTARGSVAPPDSGATGQQVGGRVAGRVSGPDENGTASGRVSGTVAGQVGGPVSGKTAAPDEIVAPVNPPGEETGAAAGTGEPVQASEAPGSSPESPSETGTAGEVAAEPSNASGAASAQEDTPSSEEQAEDAAVEDYKLKILTAQQSINDGDATQARSQLQEMLKAPDFPEKLRVDALYALADANMKIYKDDLQANFDAVVAGFERAMNADLKSPRVPRALLNLGLANLKVGNIPEAKAYFNILRKQYPHDMNIPHISYYWGDHYFEQGDYRKAADNFQYLVQNYPDSPLVRDAALGLARSLIELGYDGQAFQIVDYIEKRWPRFYVDFPPFLKLAGNVAFRMDDLDKAKDDYWTYYNIEPNAPGNDVVLARLGDIYLRLGDKKAAKEIYENVAERFPDEEGGLVAKMRLAEEGIYDDPSMDQMFSVFDRPFSLKPEKIYSTIVRKFPKSPLAPLAQLKLGMWYYFNKKYADALRSAQDLLGKYPRSELVPKARQLGFKVFNLAVPQLVKDENYGRVISYWEKYGDLLKEQGDVDEDIRMSVALSYWKKGMPEKALAIIKPYLAEKKQNKYSEMALDMALSIYLETGRWSEIANLSSMVRENWELPPRQRNQVDYSLAVAYENLGEMARSEPLWSKLAADTDLDPSTRAYAMYYMAKAAMQDKELRKVFIYSQEALTMFLESAGDREKIKDCILMTIYAAEESGRYREALRWAEQYDKYVPEGDPEWAGSRFRLARLYQKAGAQEEWEQIMQEIKKKQPQGIYGKMAAQALDTQNLEQAARQYGLP
jgi:TolA-binding protein